MYTLIIVTCTILWIFTYCMFLSKNLAEMLSLGLGTWRKVPSDFSKLSKFFLRKRASSVVNSLSLSRGGELSGEPMSASSEEWNDANIMIGTEVIMLQMCREESQAVEEHITVRVQMLSRQWVVHVHLYFQMCNLSYYYVYRRRQLYPCMVTMSIDTECNIGVWYGKISAYIVVIQTVCTFHWNRHTCIKCSGWGIMIIRTVHVHVHACTHAHIHCVHLYMKFLKAHLLKPNPILGEAILVSSQAHLQDTTYIYM